MKKFIVALLVVSPLAAAGCGGDTKVVAPTVVPEKPGAPAAGGSGSGAAKGGAGSTTSASATN